MALGASPWMSKRMREISRQSTSIVAGVGAIAGSGGMRSAHHIDTNGSEVVAESAKAIRSLYGIIESVAKIQHAAPVAALVGMMRADNLRRSRFEWLFPGLTGKFRIGL